MKRDDGQRSRAPHGRGARDPVFDRGVEVSTLRPGKTPSPPASGLDRTTLVQIEKPIYGGNFLAREEGKAIFVPLVLPGERARVRLVEEKRGYATAELEEILTPSPRRIVPACPHFGPCGGCQYQHAEYSFQLRQKLEIFRETLQRLGGIVFDDEIEVLAGEPWHYRNRIQLHFREEEAGFHRRGSHELVGIDHCYISSPMLNEVIVKLSAASKQPEWPRFLRSLEIFTNETQVQLNVIDSTRPVAVRFFDWCATFLPGLSAGAVDYSAARHTFRISRGSFFQVNRFLIDTLVEETMGAAAGRRAIDLYAGVGLFSLALAERFELVEAVERGGPAYRDLEWNAKEAAPNIRPSRVSAEEFLQNVSDPPDLIVADPPRAGLGKEATAELLRIRAPRIVLVSCDPATLTRDLKKLLAAYKIERLSLIDLFPQTYHFEAVAHLARL